MILVLHKDMLLMMVTTFAANLVSSSAPIHHAVLQICRFYEPHALEQAHTHTPTHARGRSSMLFLPLVDAGRKIRRAFSVAVSNPRQDLPRVGTKSDLVYLACWDFSDEGQTGRGARCGGGQQVQICPRAQVHQCWRPDCLAINGGPD